ncbi:MAG: hypothetical protein K0U12_02420 [Gammaproteobacteria bacterium]|nr:hypothetical protein [Gammaproteobacteria bacterium]
MINKIKNSLLITMLMLISVNVNAATLKAHYGDFQRRLPERFVGLNGQLTKAGKNPWKRRPSLLMTLERSAVKLMRYPGGEVGNYWDFSSGWVDPNTALTVMPKYIARLRKSTNRYTLTDLALAQRITNITPIFNLNLVTASAEQLQQTLQLIRQNKLPLKLVELGDNFFPSDVAAREKYAKVFPNGKSYAKRAEDWLEAVKDINDNIQVAVATTLNSTADVSARKRAWNEEVAEYTDDADAYALTFQFNSGIMPQQTATKSLTWGSLAEQREAVRNFNLRQGVVALLAQPYIAWHKDLAQTPIISHTDKPIWITSFNLSDSVGVVRHTWGHALAIANALNLFLSDPRVRMALLNNIYSIYPKYTAIFPPNDIFYRLRVKPEISRYVGQRQFKTTAFDLTAEGQVLRWFARAMNGQDQATQLVFAPGPELEVNGYKYPAIFGWAFSRHAKSLKQPNVIIVNELGRRVTVDVSALNLGKYRYYQQFNTDPRAYVTSEHFLSRLRDRLRKRLQLPAYSLTIIK